MNRIYTLFFIFQMFVLAIFTSCNRQEPTAGNTGNLQVITTLFPLYDFVRHVGGEEVDVTLLLPPGVEAHSYSPTPKELVQIGQADIFIYTGPFMEPWAEDLPASVDSSELMVVDISGKVKLEELEDHEGCSHNDSHHVHTEACEHGHTNTGLNIDPHIWLDPILAQQMVGGIAEALSAKDPANKQKYEENSQKLIAELEQLDKDIRETLAKCKHKTIIYGGHFAFGYFSRRYGLEYMSPYKGVSPNSQARPQETIRLIDKVKEMDIKAIFYEELVQPKMAEIISEETGTEMLLLHGAHNVSKKEFKNGITYLDIMRANLERLKKGLEYTP